MTWIEPCAAEHGQWTDWIVYCDQCPTMTWNRWTQRRFALQAAESHRRAHR